MTSTPRRLAALTFGVASLAAVALAGPVAAADGGSQQFVTTTTTPAQAEAQQSHVDQDKLGISAMNHAVRGKSEPFIYADPGSVRPTLMLPAAAAPYDVAQLATKFTSAFSTLPGGGLLLDIPLEVADGAIDVDVAHRQAQAVGGQPRATGQPDSGGPPGDDGHARVRAGCAR